MDKSDEENFSDYDEEGSTSEQAQADETEQPPSSETVTYIFLRLTKLGPIAHIFRCIKQICIPKKSFFCSFEDKIKRPHTPLAWGMGQTLKF